MLDSLFPAIPTFYAQWKAIYFEPVVNSGEKITVLIVVKTKDSIEAYEALHPTVVDNLYGSKSKSFISLIQLIKKELIRNNGEVPTAFEGVSDGVWHEAQSSDLKGIFRQGLYKSASLGAVALKGLYESEEIYSDNEQIDNRWSKRIKQAFLDLAPNYLNNFDVKIKVGKEVRINCGFHTGLYTAKFNVCSSQTISRMKANLMDLQILDSYHISDSFDLILQLPSDNDLRVSQKSLARMKENISILSDEIKEKRNINIFSCNTEHEGAQRIIEMLKIG